MKAASVVIGAGFGDEGKGLATDCLAAAGAAGAGTLVVRFNGGAQAGHTVVTPDGRRHVFSHVGSGTFSGAATYLSRYFVSHPMLFFDELDRLARLGVVPEVHVDPRSPVTTPWDMIINQAVESARAIGRHGSCGLGFGETLERQQHPAFRLTAGDLADEVELRRRLRDIRSRWVPQRCRQLNLGPLPAVPMSDAVLERFAEDCLRYVHTVRLSDSRIVTTASTVIFESAQGLLLDMDRGSFPHVTRSNTGLKNVVALARETGIEALDVSYVTRWYATRHGAGPMRWERATPPCADFVDRTNRPNAWQGALRFGVLDTDALTEAVLEDLGDAAGMGVRHRWLVTWADRAPPRLAFAAAGAVYRGALETLADRLVEATRATGCVLAWGENRQGVIENEARPAGRRRAS